MSRESKQDGQGVIEFLESYAIGYHNIHWHIHNSKDFKGTMQPEKPMKDEASA